MKQPSLVETAEQVVPKAERRPLCCLEELAPQGFLALQDHLPLDPVHQELQPLGDEQHDRDPAFAHRPGQDGLAAGRVGNAGTAIREGWP